MGCNNMGRALVHLKVISYRMPSHLFCMSTIFSQVEACVSMYSEKLAMRRSGYIFSMPVAAATTVRDTVVTAPIVSSPVITINKNQEPVLQEPTETVVTH